MVWWPREAEIIKMTALSERSPRRVHMLRRRPAVGEGSTWGNFSLGFEGRVGACRGQKRKGRSRQKETHRRRPRGVRRSGRESRTRRPNQSIETLCENQVCCLGQAVNSLSNMLPFGQENPAAEEREKQTCLEGAQGSVEWVGVGGSGFKCLTAT